MVLRRSQAVDERREGVIADVLDVAAAFAQRLDLAWVGIEADHLVAGLGEGHGERQPDVAEPDDSDLHWGEFRHGQGLDRVRQLPYAEWMDSPSASNPQPAPSRREGLPQAYFVRSDRERLLEAMVRVAAAKGYEEATVDDVIALAGMPRETFDENFDDKASCFLEAYDAVIDVLVAHVSTAFETASDEPWPERIAASLRALVELLSAESDIARMAMIEVTAAGDDARARYRGALARFTPFLEEGREYSDQG